MSVRKKPEKAVPVLLERLSKSKSHAMQVLKVDVADNQNPNPNHELIDGIESKLKRMTDSLKKWEKKVADQLCALEQGLNDEIFTFKDPEMESHVQEKLTRIKKDVDNKFKSENELSSTSTKLDGTESELKLMIGSLSEIKNWEKKVADKLCFLEQVLDYDVHNPNPNPNHELNLNYSKFGGIESKLKQMTDSLSNIKNWEKNVNEQLCALWHALDNLKMESQFQDKLTGIKNNVEKLKSFINPNPNLKLISKFHGIESELKRMTDSLPKIKNWEKKVVHQFCVLEQDLDDEIFKFNDQEMEERVHEKLTRVEEHVDKLKSLIISAVDDINPNRHDQLSSKLDGTETEQKQKTYSQKWAQLGVEDQISATESDAVSALSSSFHCLDNSQLQIKMCLLSLSVFPENKPIKKRPLIYWWIGEGFVAEMENATAEEAGEQVLQELLNEGFIKPTTTNNMNSFLVYPWIRLMLIQLSRKNNFIRFNPEGLTPCNDNRRAFLRQGGDGMSVYGESVLKDLLTVFNVDEKYPETTSKWLWKLEKVEVLQLGRWKDSVTHHIEVEDYEEFFKGLGSQRHLKYLSLRGISRIEKLPKSIKKLVSLQILDLRACHNLEELPPTISELRNLTHLDVSECYLLESIPRGLRHLSNLQVLKGFVAGGRSRNPCQISDLERLKQLRKLSVRVKDWGNEQLESLVKLKEALRILTISWGVDSPEIPFPMALPTSLTKLDLRSMPFKAVPDWLKPEKLPPNLEKLYVEGGKLKQDNINSHDYRKVKVKRFEHLTLT